MNALMGRGEDMQLNGLRRVLMYFNPKLSGR